MTKGKFALVDDADYEGISAYPWCFDRYAVRRNSDGPIMMHRQILGLDRSDDRHVDHRDGNKLDNRRQNLRVAHRKHNQRNSRMRKNNTSGYKGVTLASGGKKWAARISVDSRTIFLGRFDTKEDAAKAYDIGARHHFGEFALLNFAESPCE